MTVGSSDGGAPSDDAGDMSLDGGTPSEDATLPLDARAPDAGGSEDASRSIDAGSDAAGEETDGGRGETDGATLADGSLPTDATVADAAKPDAGDVHDAAGSVDASPSGIDCSPSAGGAVSSTGAPLLLACTGLYADWSTRALAPGIVAYDPGLHLWSDGASKARYILLPAGSKIDTSNIDEWTFPVGTKIWKEFTLGGSKIETRYLYKATAAGWTWTTYAWSSDGQTATELTTGATNVNGTTYEIPDHAQCQSCHGGRLDFVLGFEAIGLSTPMATGMTMQTLEAQGWLTNPPTTPITIPGDATASAALGWLHANCGNACHNRSASSLANSTGFLMRLEVARMASVEATDTYVTGVNKASYFTTADGGALMLIAAGSPSDSCVIYRDGHRDTQGEGIQMPPIDTHVVDTADVAVVASWISSL